MVAYLLQLFIFRFLQIIIFTRLFSNVAQSYVIIVDDRRNLIQLGQIAIVILVQFSIFTMMLKRKFLKKYISWLLHWKQNLNPAIGLFILIIPVAMYFSYILFYSGQYNGFSPKGLIMSIIFFAFGALAEEFVFRGFFFKLMIKRNKKYAIALVIFQALLFSYAHLFNPDSNWIRFINIFLAGIIMGIIAIRGFMYAFIFHFLWNFMQGYILGLNVSGYTFSGSLNTIFDGQPWENNIYTAVLLVTGILILLPLYYRKKKIFV